MHDASSGQAPTPHLPHLTSPHGLASAGGDSHFYGAAGDTLGGQPRSHPYRPEPRCEAATVAWRGRTIPARPRELLGAAGLVLVADLALWRGDDVVMGGPAIAAFFLAVPTLLVLAARVRRATPRLAAVLGILVAIAARCAYAPTTGSVLLGLFGVLVLAVTLRRRSSFLTDVAVSSWLTLATTHRRLAAVVAGLRRGVRGGRGEGQGARADLAAILVPVALVSVFVAVFGLANPLVGRWLVALKNSVGTPAPERAMSWLALFVGAALLTRPAVKRSAASEVAEVTSEATGGGVTVARNAMLAMNLLFAAYNALDVTYLWAGSPPPGMSERAYAHEGAVWLTVAMAMLTAVVGVMFRGALAHDARAKATRALAFGWLAQGVVLALGTFRRLAIHVATSGLSNVRILGIMGTTLVVVGLVQVGVKLLRRRTFAWLLRRQLDALLLGLLGFALLPTHLVSARVNVRRVMEHEYQALVHVEEEIAEVESAAAVLPLLDHDDERVRRGVAALLLDERDALRARPVRHGWRDRDLATTHALRELEAASPKLEAVLGDVERPDAIQPFEYIRNSAIEGEIAQSEIAKVELAPTRPEKLLRTWLERQTPALDRGETVTTTGLRTTPDPHRLEATLTFTQTTSGFVSKRERVLVLVRRPPSREWRVAVP